MPPNGVHLWRQCDTLNVARCLYQESLNPIEPRIPNRWDTNGVTGSHFPLYELILAFIYRLTGAEVEWCHRLLSLVCYFAFSYGIVIWSSGLFAESSIKYWLGSIALWLPIWFYYGFVALPDTLALPLSLWGMIFFIKWHRGVQENFQHSFFHWILSLLCFVLAGLTKIQYLAIGFGLLGWLWGEVHKINRFKNLVLVLFLGLISTVLPIYWYFYANQLTKLNGLRHFEITFRPVTEWADALRILRQNILTDLPEKLLNYANLVFLLWAVYKVNFAKIVKNTWFKGILIWIIALVIYHIIELQQMEHHDYYMLPYLPIILIFIGYGIRRAEKSKTKLIFFVLVLVQPVLISVTVLPARWLKPYKGIPSGLENKELRNTLSRLVPQNEFIIVGPDQSRTIYFYFLNHNGYAFAKSDELLAPCERNTKQSNLEYCIEKGARYIYTNDPYVLKLIAPHLSGVIFSNAGWYILKLKAR